MMNRLQACFSWIQRHPIISTIAALLLVLMLLATFHVLSTTTATAPAPISPHEPMKPNGLSP